MSGVRVVSVERRQPTPSQKSVMRGASAATDQRHARVRREVLQIIAAAEAPAPTVQEDLHSARRRPLDAAMASRHRTGPQPPAGPLADPPELPDPAIGPPTRYDIDAGDTGVGKLVIAALLALAMFAAGLAAGKWA